MQSQNQENISNSEAELAEDWMVEELEEMDPAVAVNRHANFLTIEHHIVYSPSYQVPVLYFNAVNQGMLRIHFINA
ncbi:hypothetical protein BCR43DRAFT_494536 [Syncephalastrum racemosum]|uniref:Uncharacterized protein n=1 Tax=Syncephalastrum racemosum TaxID=13706 RepID=A0A1X2H869_SYNRA|nr:hypothetical protein BCR43DRAFT_494536 [Syncephalastrum racemosum]